MLKRPVLVITIFIFIFFLFLLILWSRSKTMVSTVVQNHWQVRSIDTMKYSRDIAAEKLNDLSFDLEIDKQVKAISDTGATHIAIATPYDEEFMPILTRWVKAARKHHLKIWFRGNWSNWEGWFGHPRQMTFDEHIAKSVQFIKSHPDLFENGDSFTACPECENGAQGDPRQTGRVAEYRIFLISETAETQKAFQDIHKNVATNWLSMNGDVAFLVMDKDTVNQTGGLITIDHYVKTPQKLNEDINSLSRKTGGKVLLGEFGVPIIDINGAMTETEQAKWLDEAMFLLSKNPHLIGINYWANKGSSTALFLDDDTPKKAVDVITKYFK